MYTGLRRVGQPDGNFFILFFVLGHSHYDIDAVGIYTVINIFLAIMLMFVLKRSNQPEQSDEFDKMWLAGVSVFLFLLLLTYTTSLRVKFPLFFGILYGLLGFLVMGVLGHVQMKKPITDDSGSENQLLSFLLAIAGFIAMAYGELAHASWLWIPPKPDEIRLAAWFLCKLAIEKPNPLNRRLVPENTLNLLSRLKLIRVTQRDIQLTLKGLDLIDIVNQH